MNITQLSDYSLLTLIIPWLLTTPSAGRAGYRCVKVTWPPLCVAEVSSRKRKHSGYNKGLAFFLQLARGRRELNPGGLSKPGNISRTPPGQESNNNCHSGRWSKRQVPVYGRFEQNTLSSVNPQSPDGSVCKRKDNKPKKTKKKKMECASLPVGGCIAGAPERETKLGTSSGVTCSHHYISLQSNI